MTGIDARHVEKNKNKSTKTSYRTITTRARSPIFSTQEIREKLKKHYLEDLEIENLCNLDERHSKKLNENYIPLSITYLEKHKKLLNNVNSTTNHSYDEDREIYTQLYGDPEDSCDVKIDDLIKHSSMLECKRLVTGVAGIGKTVFSRHLLYFWAKHDSKEQYKWLFFIPLRNLLDTRFYPKDASPISFFEVLLRECFDPLKCYAREQIDLQCIIEKANKDGEILLILDGYDEIADVITPVEFLVTQRDEKETAYSKGIRAHYLEPIFKELVTQPHVLLTSRPYNLHSLEHYSFKVKSKDNIQITGFTIPYVKKYIENFFSSIYSPYSVKSSELIQFLGINPNVAGACKIPIHLVLLCNLWLLQQFPSLTSMSMLYEGFKFSLCLRALNKNHKISNRPTDTEINRKSSIHMVFLDYLAYHSTAENSFSFKLDPAIRYIKEYDEKFTKKEKDIAKEQEHYGFISTTTPRGVSSLGTYYFAHLSFKNFFSARYLADCLQQFIYKSSGEQCINNYHLWCSLDEDKSNAIEFIKQHKYRDSFEITLWFIAGYLANAKDINTLIKFFNILEDDPKDITGFYNILLIIRCLDEAQVYIDGLSESKYMMMNEYYNKIGKWLRLSCNQLSGLKFVPLSDRLKLSRRLLQTPALADVFVDIVKNSPLSKLEMLLEHLHATLKIPTLINILITYFDRLSECSESDEDMMIYKKCVGKLTDWSLNNSEIADAFQQHGLAVDVEEHVALDSDWRLMYGNFTHWVFGDWRGKSAEEVVEALNDAFSTPFLMKFFDCLEEFSKTKNIKILEFVPFVWGRIFSGFVVGLIERKDVKPDQANERLNLSFNTKWAKRVIKNMEVLSRSTQKVSVRVAAAKAWGKALGGFIKALTDSHIINSPSETSSNWMTELDSIGTRLELALLTDWAMFPLNHLSMHIEDDNEEVRGAAATGLSNILANVMMPLNSQGITSIDVLESIISYLTRIANLKFIHDIIKKLCFPENFLHTEFIQITLIRSLSNILSMIMAPLIKIDLMTDNLSNLENKYLKIIFTGIFKINIISPMLSQIKSLAIFYQVKDSLFSKICAVTIFDICVALRQIIEPLSTITMINHRTLDIIESYLVVINKYFLSSIIDLIGSIFLCGPQLSEVYESLTQGICNILNFMPNLLRKINLNDQNIVILVVDILDRIRDLTITKNILNEVKDFKNIINNDFYYITYLRLNHRVLRNCLLHFWSTGNISNIDFFVEKFSGSYIVDNFFNMLDYLPTLSLVDLSKEIINTWVDIIAIHLIFSVFSHIIDNPLTQKEQEEALEKVFQITWVLRSYNGLKTLFLNSTYKDLHEYIIQRWGNLGEVGSDNSIYKAILFYNLDKKDEVCRKSDLFNFIQIKSMLISMLTQGEESFSSNKYPPLRRTQENRAIVETYNCSQNYLISELNMIGYSGTVISGIEALISLQNNFKNPEEINKILKVFAKSEDKNERGLYNLLRGRFYQLPGKYELTCEGEYDYIKNRLSIVDLTDLLEKIALDADVDYRFLSLLFEKTPTSSLLNYIFKLKNTLIKVRQNILAILVLRFINSTKTAYIDDQKLYYYNAEKKRYTYHELLSQSKESLRLFLSDFSAAFRNVTGVLLTELVSFGSSRSIALSSSQRSLTLYGNSLPTAQLPRLQNSVILSNQSSSQNTSYSPCVDFEDDSDVPRKKTKFYNVSDTLLIDAHNSLPPPAQPTLKKSSGTVTSTEISVSINPVISTVHHEWYTEDQIHTILCNSLLNKAIVMPQTQIEHHSLLIDNLQQALRLAKKHNQPVVIPLHIHEAHWTGMVIKINNQGSLQIIYNDPLGGSFHREKQAENIVMLITEHDPNATIIDLQLRQQTNGNDCGPFTADNLIQLATHSTDNLSHETICALLQTPCNGSAEQLRQQHLALFMNSSTLLSQASSKLYHSTQSRESFVVSHGIAMLKR